MLFLSIWIIVARMFVDVLQKMVTLYDSGITIILHQGHWLILYLLKSVFCFLSFELLQSVFYLFFYNKWFLSMIKQWLLSYIQFIDWFIACLNLYGVSFYFDYCSWYGICCFTRSDYFNDCEVIFIFTLHWLIL